MRLQAKDIVLSDSLHITFHLYQTKCLLTISLQNKVIETQQAKAPAVILNHNVCWHSLKDLQLAYSASSSPSTSLIMTPVSFD